MAFDWCASASQVLRQGDNGFFFAETGEACHRLADGDDLSGFGRRRGDDAVGVGFEFGISELIAGEFERALRARQPALGLVVGRLLAIEIGNGGVATRFQGVVALQVGGGLCQAGGRGGQLRLRALDLQRQVLRVEPRNDIAGTHPVADIHDAGDDLAADPEGEIGLVAGAHDADEFAR